MPGRRQRSPQIAHLSSLIQHTESCEARHFANAPNARELSMTDSDLSPDDVPTHPCVASYEAHLIRLVRELPSFERELCRVEARRMRGGLACCDLA
jgi:hypothetical protein